MSAKNAFTSPARNHGLRRSVVKVSGREATTTSGRGLRSVKESARGRLAPSARSLRSAAPPAFAERLAREHAGAAAIAARLPAGVRFGTSSWSFPDWAGLVYSRAAKVGELAREGLREYAGHPLLTTVGIDRSYYAPIPPQDLVRYAEQLPPDFPCCAKAPEAVTAMVRSARSGGPRNEPNPDYLTPRLFADELLGPFREVFADHAGPFLLQFPPAPASVRPRPEEFAEALERFLAALPRDFRYAV